MQDKQTTKLLLTVWNEDLKQDELHSIISTEEWFVKHLQNYCIGAIEQTESEKEHFHVYLKFDTVTRFTTIKNKLNCQTIHLDECDDKLKSIYNYCTKEGVYDTNIPEEDLVDVYNNSIEDELVADIFDRGFSIIQVIRKYPKFAVYKIAAIKELIGIRDEENFKNSQK